MLHPVAENVTITGTVTDAKTGLPLKGANVTSDVGSVVSDEAGHYSVTAIRGNAVTASRVGYISVNHPATGSPLDFALPQTATVTVKTSAGQTISLDAPSTKFGYQILFQGYAAGDTLNLCRVSGEGSETFQPNKSEIKRIIGPAHSVTSAPCCDRGPVMAIDLELKSGGIVTTYLVDTCFGYEVDVIGIERSSATPKYVHLTDVSEITLP